MDEPIVTGPRRRDRRRRSNYWLVVLAVPVSLFAWVALFTLQSFVVAPAFGPVVGYGVGAAQLLAYAAAPLSAAAFYVDQQYVVTRSDWRPSILYVSMVVPVFGAPAACLYLYRRRRNLRFRLPETP